MKEKMSIFQLPWSTSRINIYKQRQNGDIKKQGNRGDMQKIQVTLQPFEASGRHGDFFEKTKDPF